MSFEPIGNVFLKNELTHTKLWPGLQHTLKGVVDLASSYKEALAGQLVPVMEIGVDGSYLVLGKTKDGTPFIWMIEKEDVREYIPFVYKNNTFVPGGLSPIEEFEYLAKIKYGKK